MKLEQFTTCLQNLSLEVINSNQCPNFHEELNVINEDQSKDVSFESNIVFNIFFVL